MMELSWMHISIEAVKSFSVSLSFFKKGAKEYRSSNILRRENKNISDKNYFKGRDGSCC